MNGMGQSKFHHFSGAEWKKGPGRRKPPGQRWHLPALPTTLARLLLRSQASRKEKRPHTASTQPLSLHQGYLAPDGGGISCMKADEILSLRFVSNAKKPVSQLSYFACFSRFSINSKASKSQRM